MSFKHSAANDIYLHDLLQNKLKIDDDELYSFCTKEATGMSSSESDVSSASSVNFILNLDTDNHYTESRAPNDNPNYGIASTDWVFDVMEDICAPLQSRTEYGKHVLTIHLDQEQYSCNPRNPFASLADHGITGEKESAKRSPLFSAPCSLIERSRSKTTNKKKRYGKALLLPRAEDKVRNGRIRGIQKKKKANFHAVEKRLLEEMEALVYSAETDFDQLC